jgi:hypothetical protein
MAQRLQRIIEEGYEFKIGDYISEGFRLMNKNAGNFIAWFLIFIVISVMASLIPYGGSLLNSLLIGPAFTMGCYLVARKTQLGEASKFEDFFEPFKKPLPLILVMLLVTAISLLLFLPALYLTYQAGIVDWFVQINAAQGDAEQLEELMHNFPHISMVSIVLFVVAALGSQLFNFALPMTYFYNLPPFEAIRTSVLMLAPKLLWLVLFTMVTVLIAMAGLLVCVGILYTFPVFYLMQYAAFADITQLNQTAEGIPDNDLSGHLID